MESRWIEEIRSFKDIAREWDEAVFRAWDENPFLLSDFIITWWGRFYEKAELRILVVYDEGKIAGGIPLYLSRTGLLGGFARVLCHIGGPVANYTEPLYAAPNVQMLSLLRKALDKRDDWDALYLSDVREKNRLIAECRGLPFHGQFTPYIVQDHMNWAIDLAAGREKYMATVSRKLKHDLRAKRRHLLKKYGEIRLKEIKGREEVARLFDLYTRFSLQAFNKRGRSSAFEDEQYTAFFRDFLALMDERQRLDAHALMAGDEVLAISFGYRFAKGYNWALTGFNYENSYYRPGYLLAEELIKEICGRGGDYLNWYGHETFYKTQWCNSTMPLYRFYLIRHTARGMLYSACRAVERILRSNRSIVGIAKKLKRS